MTHRSRIQRKDEKLKYKKIVLKLYNNNFTQYFVINNSILKGLKTACYPKQQEFMKIETKKKYFPSCNKKNIFLINN